MRIEIQNLDPDNEIGISEQEIKEEKENSFSTKIIEMEIPKQVRLGCF